MAKEKLEFEIIVPDTSAIIEGILSKRIEKGDFKISKVMFHEAVLAELENQANENRSIGFIGLDEIEKLRLMSDKHNFVIEFSGRRPNAAEINFAKKGEIDSLIRLLAFENSACLITADVVQAKIGKARGVNVLLISPEKVQKKIKLESFFDDTTMSAHLRENMPPYAKKGRPGEWGFVKVSDKKLTREDIIKISSEIIEEAGFRRDCFIEIERAGSTIVQLGKYRIVITRPPFSDAWEITAVKPVKKLGLDDYKLPEEVTGRIAVQAEGILIAGAPGQGKSTFAQALAEFYASQEKIIKTVEAPRDLQLPDSITQYAISHGSPEEVHDVLLLSRPDYTIFDEMRNTEDFKLFADMRLSGVGMIGIVHATNAIDAIQRFIGRIELGTIPQIIDTVIFIKDGGIGKIFEVKMEVKVPSGMMEADLARPIVTVYDFISKELEFELYSYGEETVVVPVSLAAGTKKKGAAPAQALAAKQIEAELLRYSDHVEVEVTDDNNCTVRVPEKFIAGIIGKQGATIDKIQKKLGIHINVEPLDEETVAELSSPKGEEIPFEVDIKKKAIDILLPNEYANKDIDVYVDNDFLVELHAGKKAVVKVKKDNNIGKVIMHAINNNRSIKLFGD